MATTRCETTHLHNKYLEGGNENVDARIPTRHLLATNETRVGNSDGDTLPTSSDDDRLKFALPRIEVQFLCEHDIRPDFNVSETFESFFQETLNHYFNQFLDVVHNDFDNWTLTGDTVSDVSVVEKSDMELYSAISISDIGDINRQYWFYPLCNESSPEILATMDVRGYVSLPTHLPSGGNQQQQMQHDGRTHAKYGKNSGYNENAAVINFMEYFSESVDQKMIRNYFKDRVCKQLDFFRSKVVEWDDQSFPPPSNHQPIKEYQSAHDSNAGRYNYHHFFDHNLYLLCGGAEDIMYFDDSDDGIDQGFLMLGIIVGMVMISMFCTELKPFIDNASTRNRRRRNDGYSTTTIQEVEMV